MFYELRDETNFKPDLKMKVVGNTCGEGIWRDEACQLKLTQKGHLKTS